VKRPAEQDDVGRAVLAATVLGGVFATAALVTHGGRAAASVLVGAAIAIANLLTMRAIIRALVRPPPDRSGRDDARDVAPRSTDRAEAPRPGDAPVPDLPERNAADRAGAGRRGGSAWALLAVFKTFILLGGIGFLLTRGLVDPIPLVIGYGVLPLGIVASALWSSLRPE
jgi:hypothetical protein